MLSWAFSRGRGAGGSEVDSLTGSQRRSTSLPMYSRAYYTPARYKSLGGLCIPYRFAFCVLLLCCVVLVLFATGFQAQVIPSPLHANPPLAFNYDGKASKATHLVIVAGHAVLNFASDLKRAASSDDAWHLLEYQKGSGLPEAILTHIKEGLKVAENDPSALLVFSGGETRRDVGPISEGASYYAVTDALSVWGDSNVRARTITEEYATDSLQNLLFSICRFREITNSYPLRITVVSFSFKSNRFVNQHARAILWPSNALSFIGVDPPTTSGFDLESASRGERENSASAFEKDPYGCNSKQLIDKRISRNPFSRSHNYATTCSEISGLLSYCGDLLYTDELPWRT